MVHYIGIIYVIFRALFSHSRRHCFALIMITAIQGNSFKIHESIHCGRSFSLRVNFVLILCAWITKRSSSTTTLSPHEHRQYGRLARVEIRMAGKVNSNRENLSVNLACVRPSRPMLEHCGACISRSSNKTTKIEQANSKCLQCY